MWAVIKRVIGFAIHDTKKYTKKSIRYFIHALLRGSRFARSAVRFTLFAVLMGLAIPFLLIAAICGIVGSALIEAGDEIGLPSRAKKVAF